jgi:hypothetical protein
MQNWKNLLVFYLIQDSNANSTHTPLFENWTTLFIHKIEIKIQIACKLKDLHTKKHAKYNALFSSLIQDNNANSTRTPLLQHPSRTRQNTHPRIHPPFPRTHPIPFIEHKKNHCNSTIPWMNRMCITLNGAFGMQTVHRKHYPQPKTRIKHTT